MIAAIEQYFPSEVQFTRPEGGMFLWLTLPEGQSSMHLFDLAIRENVAFVPGNPFYVGKTDVNTCRLNFSCSNVQDIEIGIRKLGKAIKLLQHQPVTV